MPTLDDFIFNFNIRDLFVLLLTAVIIVIAREGKHIFGRRGDAAGKKKVDG